jgi:hypothetical protein
MICFVLGNFLKVPVEDIEIFDIKKEPSSGDGFLSPGIFINFNKPFGAEANEDDNINDFLIKIDGFENAKAEDIGIIFLCFFFCLIIFVYNLKLKGRTFYL